MTHRDRISRDYFEWIFDLVCSDRYPETISYRKLLSTLHAIPFRYSILMDANRFDDGVDLRYHYEQWTENIGAAEYLTGPCSVLELIMALAIRCEDFMDDPSLGDRTAQWFWGMIVNLGLGAMTDDNFDREYVEYVIERFLNREYEPDGRGGLFTVRHCTYDLRTIEIWRQMCYYLDTIE